MNSEQINKILKRHLRHYFRGVYASDTIPSPKEPFPYAIIVNTDKAGQPGEHWQAIWIESLSRVEFFDSFGNEASGNIRNFLQNFKTIKQNKKKIQLNLEISCGPYVIYFLIFRFRGISLIQIVKNLKKQLFPDTFVKFFVHSLIKL
jgi:hypothetical protein